MARVNYQPPIQRVVAQSPRVHPLVAGTAIARIFRQNRRQGMVFMEFEGSGPIMPMSQACRRMSRRRRLFQAAVLAEDADSPARDCLIRDISASGAQLRLNPGQCVPRNAYLINLMSRMAYLTDRVWQHGTLAGVSFDGGGVLGPAWPTDLDFLNRHFVLGKLRQISLLSGQGMDLTAVLTACNISHETYRQWLETFVF